MGRRLALLLGVVILTGCTRPEAEALYAVRDSAGVTLATNRVAHAPVFAEVSDSAELRIESQEQGPALFHRIRSVFSLAEGRIVVGDAGSAEARVFTRVGSHVFSVGGEGGGPGEIRHLAWVSSRETRQEILLWDDGSMRGQRFRSDGSFIGATPVLRSADHPLLYAVGVRDNDLVVMGGPPSLRTGPDGRLWQWTDYLLVKIDGEIRDTIGTFPTLECHPDSERVCRDLEGRSGGISAWTDELFFHVIVDRPELKVFDLKGRLLTRAELQLSDSLSEVRNSGSSDTTQGGRTESAAILSWVSADAGGRAWLRLSGTGTWYVLEPKGGRLLGTVTLPPRLHPREIGNDYILGVERDEFDVPAVVRYRLTPPTD